MVLACATVAGLAMAARAPCAQAETTGAPTTPAQAGPLPFTDAELEQALLARLLTPPDETGVLRPTRVEPAGPGAVRVQVGTRSRVVSVGERTGAAAARVVALVIAELVSAGPDVSATGAPVPAVSPPIAPPSRAAQASAPPRVQVAVPRVCLTGGVTKGVGNQELLAGTLDADLIMPIGRGRFRLAPSVGLVITPTRNSGTFDEVAFVGAALRLLGGPAIGPVELLGGPLLSPYTIGGATPHDGVLFGAEVVARVTAPLAARLWLVAATRADGYANRVRVHWADGRAYATPRLGIAVDIGLAWSWAS